MEGAMLPAFSLPLGLKLILVHGLVKSVSAVAVCPDLLIYVLQTLIFGPKKLYFGSDIMTEGLNDKM